MAYHPRQQRAPEQWRELVAQQAASGQTQAEFCAAQRLSKTTFQHWKRRLGQTRGAASAPPPTLFTRLAGTSDTGVRTAGEAPENWTIELDLGAGVCLRIRRGDV